VGYAVSSLILIAVFLATLVTQRLFWIAFVLTRPLGATAGDLLTQTHDKGGLGFGTVGSAANHSDLARQAAWAMPSIS
jgi:uncharacterized membrane-anchored protein